MLQLNMYDFHSPSLFSCHEGAGRVHAECDAWIMRARLGALNPEPELTRLFITSSQRAQ